MMTERPADPSPVKTGEQSSRFKLFHKLMSRKVRHILLISTSYEAWIMEEDCRLSEQIINEYRGLNLSRPPQLTWVSSTEMAVEKIGSRSFDLVIVISRAVDEAAYGTGEQIKARVPSMPVILLTHQEVLPEAGVRLATSSAGIDRIFYWSGDAGILLAIIKHVEDRMNVGPDTACAGIRVIIVVEDSPFYRSVILPALYRELVTETQALIEDSLNEEHRILSMRARPKILLAGSYEQAMEIYETYKPYVLGVISDVRFPKNSRLDGEAGLKLLRYIKSDRFDIPLLLASSEPENAEPAARVPAVFIDKNASRLQERIAGFLMDYLGFGPFVFREPDGTVIQKASDLFELEQGLGTISEASFVHHCRQNDFSRWLFSLAEVELANQLRPVRGTDFDSVETHRQHLMELIREKRRERLKGVVVDFDKHRFDPETGFLKTGKGSLGGKARGQAFISWIISRSGAHFQSFEGISVMVPQTLVITTEGFDEFIRLNGLGDLMHRALGHEKLSDEDIAERFMDAEFPESLKCRLITFLKSVHYPLAVRSSSLLEDARFKPYAGLYKTFFVPNDDADTDCRILQLMEAVKMVWASTFYRAPRAFTRRVGNRMESEKMAVIIQQVVGSRYGDHFYPAVSGVAQSKNYYPFSRMTPEDGIVNIAMGLGKAVMEGENNLRFCPRYPEILPQRSTVRDLLENAQQYFYALKMGDPTCSLGVNDAATLVRRDLHEAKDEHPVRVLSSTYFPADDRIRDTWSPKGFPVLTFASLLKYKSLPVAEIIRELLELGSRELGCPVEIEFALDLSPDASEKARFAVLQIRPMSAREEMLDVTITEEDTSRAFCISHMALGNTVSTDMADIIYVKPETFDPSKTVDIVPEIADINRTLSKTERKYILIGPGRWGTADRWLGIPVTWGDISGVGAIVETVHPEIQADPSQGSHFFHNITALGINYFNTGHHSGDLMNISRLTGVEKIHETAHVVHVRTPKAVLLKVDGRNGNGIIREI
ncbi:MAG: phosphoenolpyruvate synthase/pyruvate phosphate dikinase [Desulfobacterales bacterium]|nr:phosphoenolpyruvate synthase/pyruvate phosphate dikinase [Desulfobacterales bacterium]